MKNKKDLAKYLAEYVEHVFDDKKEMLDFDTAVEFTFDTLLDIIEEGLDAFESTENCVFLFRSQIAGVDFETEEPDND